jgi:hypothetical protein
MGSLVREGVMHRHHHLAACGRAGMGTRRSTTTSGKKIETQAKARTSSLVVRAYGRDRDRDNRDRRTNNRRGERKPKQSKLKSKQGKGVKKSLKASRKGKSKSKRKDQKNFVEDVAGRTKELGNRLADAGQDAVGRVRERVSRGNNNTGFSLSAQQQPLFGRKYDDMMKLGPQTVQVLVVCTLGAILVASSLLRGNGRNRGGFRRRRGKARGTWVKDRSLGGKMIFVPATSMDQDDNLMYSSTTATATSSSYNTAAAAANPPAPSSSSPPKPVWWQYDEFSGREKESMRPQVQQLMVILEDAKAVYGRDVNVFDLVELKQLCQRFNLQVKPKTDNSRDSMFRTAIQGSLDAIESGSDFVGGGSETVPELLNGLSLCLGVPQKRAAVICNGEVAARLRANILQTVVFSRTNKDVDFSMSLIKMDNILSKLPFQENAPEIDVITRSLKNRMTDGEREKMVKNFPEQNAQTLKEILGF